MKTKRILYACTDAVTDALNSGIRAASTLSFSQCIPVHKGIKGVDPSTLEVYGD